MTTTFAVVRAWDVSDFSSGYPGSTDQYVLFGDRSIGPAWIEHSWSMSTGTLDEHGVQCRRYRNPPPDPRSSSLYVHDELADWERELLGEEPYQTITIEVPDSW